jgi:hypothetical protein
MTMDDTEFVTRALARLPELAPPPGLSRRILAGYDTRQAQGGLWTRLCDIVWPGAPLWAPASAFGAALLLGVSLGAVLPAGGQSMLRFSLDQPASFTLDTQEDL